ncbi:hypothetical protein CEXT_208231 [Caerostris extrusa]|uniref:Transposase n=1 Tax=Caerostris extrusa TaxID=172846 RepID=A0AAV4MGJ1_CAEEX|nr:hypothetical protein CEXT_208231 [Caerostris extrusa]
MGLPDDSQVACVDDGAQKKTEGGLREQKGDLIGTRVGFRRKSFYGLGNNLIGWALSEKIPRSLSITSCRIVPGWKGMPD